MSRLQHYDLTLYQQIELEGQGWTPDNTVKVTISENINNIIQIEEHSLTFDMITENRKQDWRTQLKQVDTAKIMSNLRQSEGTVLLNGTAL